MSNAVESLLARKRELLDIWNIREKLCLASAVACSGDQNWMSVSRSLKMICSNNQPHDWFAQKACAIQYGKLLENTETPKRKKRTERDSTSTPVETPIESLVKKLTSERIIELKQAIIDEQQEFAKLKDELACLQTADEAKVREMWQQIELEKKQMEIDLVQRQKWLKDRDIKKLELERSLRPALIFQGIRPPLQLKIKSDDMDIEESKPSQSGTPSPLLTSLLKSPSNSQAIMHPSRQAPTITNLLTASSSSASPLPTIPAIIPANPPLFIAAAQLLNVSDSCQIPASHTAPTLSMLLDKKPSSAFGQTGDSFLFSQSTQQQIFDESNIKDVDDHQLLTVLDDMMISNDDLVNILADNNAIMLNPELLEQEDILEASLKEEEDEIERMKEEMNDPEAKQAVEDLQDDIAEQMEQMHANSIAGDDLAGLISLGEVDPSPENLETDELQETIIDEQTENIELPEIEPQAETSQVQENLVEIQEVVKIEIIDSEEELPKPKIEEQMESEPVAVIDPYEFDETLEEQEIVKLHAEEKPSFTVEEKSRDSEEDIYEDAKEEIVEPTEPLPIKDEIKLEAGEETLDTDDDDTLAELQEEVKKEAQLNKSRRKRSSSKKFEDSIKEDEPPSNKRPTRNRRSDSSFVDDDSDTPLRSRRRCSSTPVTDYSVPNSPAGGDDRDFKMWRKAILIAYNRLANHKQAAQFLRPITEEQQPGYNNYVLRPMDLQTIKKNLENGTIRSTKEFKKDVCLMISNSIMYNARGSSAFCGAQEMWFEALSIIDSVMDQHKPTPGPASSSSSSSSSKEQGPEKSATKRKSMRIN